MAKTYKNKELRLGTSDSFVPGINPGEGSIRIDEGGNLFTMVSDGNELPVGGGGEVPAGIDGAGADAGQVWTADGANGADWASANPSLSDYENVVVVDAGGNGDYTTLRAALTAAPNSVKTLIIIGSDTIETSAIQNLYTN